MSIFANKIIMETEITETYKFAPEDYDDKGRRKVSELKFRDWVTACEQDFHSVHSGMYALNFYGNSNTMRLLQASCDANPKLLYGMDLYHGRHFHPIKDPYINHKIDVKSEYITVYGIDSAFMPLNEKGIPKFDEDKCIWPLTLLIDNDMLDGEIKLSCPDDDEKESEEQVVPVAPQYEYTV